MRKPFPRPVRVPGIVLLAAIAIACLLPDRARAGATVAFIANKDSPHVAFYLPALAALKETTAVFLADSSGAIVPEARRILGSKLIATYASVPELFRHCHPTIAVITLEPRLAAEAIDSALDAGCHVMAEKPACLSADQFARLAAKAERKKLNLSLAFANRLNPEMQFARDLIRRGKIGKIYGLQLQLVADQARLAEPAYQRSWFAQKSRAGGGYLIWLGIHWLDLGMYLTDSNITEVAGLTANVGGQPIDVEDSAALSLRFDNGALGTLTSAYYLDKGYHSQVKIWGSRGWIEINPNGTDPFFRYFSTLDANPTVKDYARPDVLTGYTPFIGACVRASLSLESPPVTTRDSLRAIKTVFAAYRAAETGQVQHVK